MAAFLWVFLAKLLSIAGIGGFISGLFIRHWSLAAGAGVAFGILDTLVLASVRYTGVAAISWIMAILVAVLTATLGWWLGRPMATTNDGLGHPASDGRGRARWIAAVAALVLSGFVVPYAILGGTGTQGLGLVFFWLLFAVGVVVLVAIGVARWKD